MRGPEHGPWIGLGLGSRDPAAGLFLNIQFGEHTFHRFQEGIVELPGRQVFLVLHQSQLDDPAWASLSASSAMAAAFSAGAVVSATSARTRSP